MHLHRDKFTSREASVTLVIFGIFLPIIGKHPQKKMISPERGTVPHDKSDPLFI